MTATTKPKPAPTQVMVVNDSPGEECRIAIVEDNHLEELYTERVATATSVGNIYKGRVTNVEPAIQAAFVDFGHRQAGFLHITDLHPRYFPDGGRTERVGRKIPRRSRPPIQEALRRGDEILVQVLKEGIGTKGPTLTSYLSIPGRLLVMMPGMDRVGVSRKVEDDDTRRSMRKILDELELPEGFGFILRTAGINRNKTDIKRDVAYLTRLWKVMDKRMEAVGAPCELYTESDLLIRTIRDVVGSHISAIVVDSDSAYERASMFLRVVAPRSAPRIVRYRRPTPLFHAFGIERQIDLIHSREVPLPSGGALVIEQTEALVAIDVNSGKSRSARDSESNAYHTNCEAVDEICRQLRLRDLGGLVISDLIDMRHARNRRSIEERMQGNLKRDRARTTVLRISDFGIMEMTRQRMRPSLRKTHYADCPSCAGHGELKIPETVAADAVRHVAFLLQYEWIQRIEMVCSPRVASVLLSTKRRDLVHLEDDSGKQVTIRISDAIPTDRVDFYAYDERGADVDITQVKPPGIPALDDLDADTDAPEPAESDGRTKRKGRRSRRRKPGPADASAIALQGDFEEELEELEAAQERSEEPESKPRRRRRRGRGRGDSAERAATPETDDAKPRRSRRGRRRDTADTDETPATSETHTEEAAPSRRKKRGGRRRKGEPVATETPTDTPTESKAPAPEEPTKAPAPEEPTGPVRVHVLARTLGVASKDVIACCRDGLSIEVRNHMSSVSAEDAARIRVALLGEPEPEPEPDPEPQKSEPSRRRRGRRRGRGGRKSDGAQAATTDSPTPETGAGDDTATADERTDEAPRKKGRRRRRGGRKDSADVQAESRGSGETGDDETAEAAPERRKKTRRRGRRGGANNTSDEAPAAEVSQPVEVEAPAPKPKPKSKPRKKRSLYASRRRVSPGEVADAERAAAP